MEKILTIIDKSYTMKDYFRQFKICCEHSWSCCAKEFYYGLKGMLMMSLLDNDNDIFTADDFNNFVDWCLAYAKTFSVDLLI